MSKASIPSMELARSMNLQSHVMTIEEGLRHSEMIDKLDDTRREKLHNIIKWVKDINVSFIKDLKTLLKTDEKELKEKILFILEKQEKFNQRFTKSIDKVLKDEVELEKIDDKIREYLIKYTLETREKLKNDNSNFESEIIKRELNL
ncbi:hypothetical protein [Fusobacterium mortiferum]|uniref:Uncharacterized protein n=1 Tax=Fusobacterium mortiferum TaxID=850 RepID=A0ABS2G1S0_FUSMR|nr:hypothetical protein [Fusobacterium mortiferum]MBM6874705.1 hypothetical protein [Fusobacterium mortiferum]